MIGKSIHSYQMDDGEDHKTKRAMKREEELEWRKEFADESIDDREEWINSFSGLDGRSTIGASKRETYYPLWFGDNGKPEVVIDRGRMCTDSMGLPIPIVSRDIKGNMIADSPDIVTFVQGEVMNNEVTARKLIEKIIEEHKASVVALSALLESSDPLPPIRFEDCGVCGQDHACQIAPISVSI